jgi:tetratricopeptide (TPR) repeat protein
MVRKNLMILIGLCLLAFIVACGTSEVYRIGQDMMKQNRPDEAIGYFEQALKEDQENQEYKAALLRAKQEAAKLHYEKAKKAFSEASDPTLPVLEQMAKEADLAQKLDPQNREVTALNSRMKEKIRILQESLKTLYAQADADMAKDDWLAATTKLRQVNKIFPNYEDTVNRLARSEQEGAKLFYQQGITFGNQDDWKMAAQAFKFARDINPGYLDVARQYEAAKAKDNVAYYDAEASKAVAGQKWPRAILLMEKAAEYQQDDQARLKNLDDLKKKVAKIDFEEAMRLIEADQLSGAVKKIDLARTYFPALPNDAQFKTAQKNLTTKLIERAEKTYMEKELWGNALVWLQKAEMLNPNHQELFQKIIDVKDRINKRIRKSVAVFDFGSPSNNKDAGKIVADKLITYLHRNASGDLRIIEREKLESILREMQLGQTGLVDIKSAQTVGKMRGIDTFIMGNVLQFTTKTTDNPSTAQVKVLVDEDDVPNPEYQYWLIQHPRPTEEESKTAPPRTVKKRNYQFISYKHGVAKINAMIEISYKLVDTMSGENVVTNTIPGRAMKEDKYQDAVTMANIPHDPLELPTEGEVLDDLTNQKVGEMGQSVLKKFQSLEVEYLKDARAHQKRRNFEQAIEKFTDAIYDEKLKSISTSVTQESVETIEKLTQNQ